MTIYNKRTSQKSNYSISFIKYVKYVATN